ncbi:unnamed protein product [Didymodactylos carnosus]|uniref:Uncharacterized protein n=1 Tax=Didymodactylos carnosus TaxID=1234261 RepID=A0A814N4Y7_9BILA|nr:unnamed protein product [Didymodactylos carnosus]CAF1478637.1 unnamed protein product [Didymodactylos carnosus]CAF3852468.1 unnamed protein product [Didymodactylos carnosus]CAF4269446.1 unnamed protein product [Didymodactylos carnosus]
MSSITRATLPPPPRFNIPPPPLLPPEFNLNLADLTCSSMKRLSSIEPKLISYKSNNYFLLIISTGIFVLILLLILFLFLSYIYYRRKKYCKQKVLNVDHPSSINSSYATISDQITTNDTYLMAINSSLSSTTSSLCSSNCYCNDVKKITPYYHVIDLPE